MADWVTISSLATAGGTLILAVATYQSVRSANRTARVAERSLLEGVRPVLIPSREDDPVERVRFGDAVTLEVSGHGAAVRFSDDQIYLAIALRNGGSGLAVLHGWRARIQGTNDVRSVRAMMLHEAPEQLAPVDQCPELSEFRRQQLDLYIAAGETGYWQGAIRDPEEAGYAEIRHALARNDALWVDLLYGDYEGGQRTIVRVRVSEQEETGARATILRYWNLDRENPR